MQIYAEHLFGMQTEWQSTTFVAFTTEFLL